MGLPRVAAQAAGIGLCVLALWYTGVWGFDLHARCPWENSKTALLPSYGHATAFDPMAATALIAGFKGFAADLLWLKTDEYWHHGQWHRLLPLYRLIVTLQPRFTLVWSIGGWHMAYNISEQAHDDAAEARHWVDEGLAFLKQGLKFNRDKADLYFDIGWTYYDRLKDYASALPYLEQAARKDDSTLHLRVLAHAYEKNKRPEDALRIWKILAARGDAAGKKFTATLESGGKP